jgi:hypothetical protein
LVPVIAPLIPVFTAILTNENKAAIRAEEQQLHNEFERILASNPRPLPKDRPADAMPSNYPYQHYKPMTAEEIKAQNLHHAEQCEKTAAQCRARAAACDTKPPEVRAVQHQPYPATVTRTIVAEQGCPSGAPGTSGAVGPGPCPTGHPGAKGSVGVPVKTIRDVWPLSDKQARAFCGTPTSVQGTDGDGLGYPGVAGVSGAVHSCKAAKEKALRRTRLAVKHAKQRNAARAKRFAKKEASGNA